MVHPRGQVLRVAPRDVADRSELWLATVTADTTAAPFNDLIGIYRKEELSGCTILVTAYSLNADCRFHLVLGFVKYVDALEGISFPKILVDR